MNHHIARYNAGELAGAAAAAALFGALALVSPSASAPEPQAPGVAAHPAAPAWSEAPEFPVDCLLVAAQPERHCLYY